MWLLLAFITIPMIEIALFISVGGAIGLLPTMAIVLLTAILGTHLVRSQGLAAIGKVQKSFNELNDPTEPIAHGAMILIAGVLLLTPGFFTDAVGFALLTPAFRKLMFEFARKRVRVQSFTMGSTHSASFHTGPANQSDRPSRSDVIDGEFSEVDPAPQSQVDKLDSAKKPTHTPSGWTKH
ncbi:MAG: FxsA family protein [Shimia sp.]|nr:FxsA family protein [Shimia sp.]MCP4825139.1 FxsA family protein [Shimia sp.]|mmetsp:Transcript_29364/g.57260  ORF Transcript_29364/g.57260 Transcript_29364/m.57260 type:complete len:181 (+) Transcript_29364:515-1057(+)